MFFIKLQDLESKDHCEVCEMISEKLEDYVMQNKTEARIIIFKINYFARFLKIIIFYFNLLESEKLQIYSKTIYCV